jgi:hypothetical protein
LSDRRLAAAISIAAIFSVGLRQAGIAAWHCPLDALFGQPCPGCGLTRAVGLLFSGDWRSALMIHPLAPIAATAMALVAAVAILPQPHGRRIAAVVERLERRTGCTVLVPAAMFALWVARLNGFF